ncbi:MAG: hypothetical protein WC005_04875 [Candidatus Nanopelagicales bacterium]
MQHTTLARITVAATLLLGAPIMSACGQSAESLTEQAIEAGTGSDVDIEGDKVTVTDEDGTAVSIGEDVALPSNWPSDVPTVDGTLFTVSVSETSGEASAMWKTAGDPAAMAGAYKSALEAAGYTITSETKTADLVIIGAEGNGKTISVMFSQAEGEAVVTLSVAKAS